MKKLLIVFLFGFLGVFFASESAMAMVNMPGYLPEPVQMLLFGFSLIALASFGRKKSFKK
jgi:hypothetical protein